MPWSVYLPLRRFSCLSTRGRCRGRCIYPCAASPASLLVVDAVHGDGAEGRRTLPVVRRRRVQLPVPHAAARQGQRLLPALTQQHAADDLVALELQLFHALLHRLREHFADRLGAVAAVDESSQRVVDRLLHYRGHRVAVELARRLAPVRRFLPPAAGRGPRA